MEIRWKTYNYINHPFGDLVWHLFWGIVVGIFIVYSIIFHDFWGWVIGAIALIFFFHPLFYEPRILDITLGENGLYINNNFYSWEKFYAFEIFTNSYRKYIFLFPRNFSFGLHFPLEEFFVSEQEIKEFVSRYLKEVQGEVPLSDRIYRFFYI